MVNLPVDTGKVHKMVYLTIDDGPSMYFRRKIDYLVSKNIPAILFCRGDLMEGDMRSVAYAIHKGFVIGNHSYSHPKFSKLSVQDAIAEIEKTDLLIEEAYRKAKVPRTAKLFRFPYGDKGGSLFSNKHKMLLQKSLRDRGYANPGFAGITYNWYRRKGFDRNVDVFWTHDFEEYRLDFTDVLRRMKKIDTGSSEILLIHDHERTAETFFRIMDELIRKGIEFRLPIY